MAVVLHSKGSKCFILGSKVEAVLDAPEGTYIQMSSAVGFYVEESVEETLHLLGWDES